MTDATPYICNLYSTHLLVTGLTSGVLCVGREVRKHAQTRVFKSYYKWPCDNLVPLVDILRSSKN